MSQTNLSWFASPMNCVKIPRLLMFSFLCFGNCWSAACHCLLPLPVDLSRVFWTAVSVLQENIFRTALRHVDLAADMLSTYPFNTDYSMCLFLDHTVTMSRAMLFDGMYVCFIHVWTCLMSSMAWDKYTTPARVFWCFHVCYRIDESYKKQVRSR